MRLLESIIAAIPFSLTALLISLPVCRYYKLKSRVYLYTYSVLFVLTMMRVGAVPVRYVLAQRPVYRGYQKLLPADDSAYRPMTQITECELAIVLLRKVIIILIESKFEKCQQ